MKRTDIAEVLIIFTICYLLTAFVMASINYFQWGIIPRSAYIILSLSLIVLNKKLNV